MSDLRVVILINNDLTSNIIASQLLNEKPGIVSGLFFSNGVDNSSAGLLKSVMNLFNTMSIKYWAYLIFVNGLFRIYNLSLSLSRPNVIKKRHYSAAYLASKNSIATHHVSTFSDQDTLSKIKSHNPDLIICRISEIVDQNLLNIPKFGCWCIHSSILPAYRGIASEFHALKNSEKKMGSTVFAMNERLDRGEILRSECFAVNLNQTVFWHTVANNLMAAQMVAALVEEISLYHKVLPQVSKRPPQPSYYTWPKPSDLAKFKKAANGLIRTQDLFIFWYLFSGTLTSDAITK